MSFDIKNLMLFVRIAESGRIGKAGESLGLSTTNASQRIQQLESSLNVKLLHRSTRVVSLTHEGEVFLEHARRILNDIEQAKNAFRHDNEQVQGKIKLTVSASYGRIYIVPFLPEFLQRHPNLQVEIDFTDRNVDIVEKGYDLAFRMGSLPSNSLLARRIADNPSVIVASPQYLNTHGIPKTPEDLIDHACIPFADQDHWQFRHTSGNRYSIPVKGALTLNWGDAISDMVEANMGIGLASLWHVAPSIKMGKAVPILQEYEVYPRTNIWAVRPGGRVTPGRVKVFLDYIEQVITKTNVERYSDMIPSDHSRPD
ncbi:LysR family transcriptional regulator [Vibrio rarus]|uniref:LysR family transcriptional regulator n=1 Tax=Vibrio rarus TaxID=413403 RepID=UPI0021C43768|nr:LysR family transcriptional regulator [Vibrio rarus]